MWSEMIVGLARLFIGARLEHWRRSVKSRREAAQVKAEEEAKNLNQVQFSVRLEDSNQEHRTTGPELNFRVRIENKGSVPVQIRGVVLKLGTAGGSELLAVCQVARFALKGVTIEVYHGEDFSGPVLFNAALLTHEPVVDKPTVIIHYSGGEKEYDLPPYQIEPLRVKLEQHAVLLKYRATQATRREDL